MPWGTGNLEKAASLGHIRPEGDPHVPVPKHCEWLLSADRDLFQTLKIQQRTGEMTIPALEELSFPSRQGMKKR